MIMRLDIPTRMTHLFDNTVAELMKMDKQDLINVMNRMCDSARYSRRNKKPRLLRVDCLDRLISEDERLKAITTALLMIYIRKENTEGALEMLNRGAEWNVFVKSDIPTNLNEKSPLCQALYHDLEPVVLELIKLGAAVQIEDYVKLVDLTKWWKKHLWQETVDLLAQHYLKEKNSRLTSVTAKILIEWESKYSIQAIKRLEEVQYWDSVFCDVVEVNPECFKLVMDKFYNTFLQLDETHSAWSLRLFTRAFYRNHISIDNLFDCFHYMLNKVKYSPDVCMELKRTLRRGITKPLLRYQTKPPKLNAERLYRILDFLLRTTEMPVSNSDMDLIYSLYEYDSVFKQLLLRPIQLECL